MRTWSCSCFSFSAFIIISSIYQSPENKCFISFTVIIYTQTHNTIKHTLTQQTNTHTQLTKPWHYSLNCTKYINQQPPVKPSIILHWLNSLTHTTICWLSGLCPAQPRWAGTRRNIHPLTPIVVINRPLSASSIYYNPWHPPCSTYMPDSLFSQSLSKFSLVYLLAWHPQPEVESGQ